MLFSQGGSHQLPCLEAFAHSIWQRDDRVHFAPVPDSCLVRIAEAEPRHTSIQIKSQTIGLPFFAPIVACIREQADLQKRQGLQFPIRREKTVMREKEVATLLH